MHTILKKMKELKQLKEEESTTSTDLPGRRNRKAKTTSRRRRIFMQELRERRELASSTETDDSSVEQLARPRQQRKPRPKKTSQHKGQAPAKQPSEVATLEQEIRKLKCTQDQMENYQLSLEKDYRKLQRQLLATDFSKQMTEMKNRELQEEMREIVEDQLRFDKSIKHGAKTSDQREQDYLGEIGLLQIENRILRQKLERCEQSLLESGQQSLLESRHQTLLASIQQQPDTPADDER